MSEIPTYPNEEDEKRTAEELDKRWRALFLAESNLQHQRDEIVTRLEDLPGITAEALNEVREIMREHNTRPSPDYRALLLNTRKQLEVIATSHRGIDEPTRAALKEALRLTDVERLPLWVSSLQGVAMRMVVDETIADLQHECDQDAAGVWRDEMIRDLEEARDNPQAYLERRSAQRMAHNKARLELSRR
jgi:predicted nucleic acid-binding protein